MAESYGATTRPAFVQSAYDPNRYADHRVLYPPRSRTPSTWRRLCALPAQWISTRQNVVFHVLHVLATLVMAIVAWLLLLLGVLLLPLWRCLGPLVARIALCLVLQLASMDVHLYNSISPGGEHIYVSFAYSDTRSHARVLQTLLYLASAKIVLAAATSGVAVVFVLGSLLLLAHGCGVAWSQDPSLPRCLLGTVCLYSSIVLSHVLARAYRRGVQRLCCDYLDLYRFVYGYCMATAYHTPLQLMGFGHGQVV
ncbi:hypothetical protein SPRG_02144 [Saprolegnia parasitica CBS 223.65]|uniref:Uncharacterized protein n=1 Tax=Saprolegnia parasitica (strain CBS 223.65) TaxID=695850 RepID=A0A067D3M7_SAPPC|nr:hypothetical protein SPRG_02144 [Saprolegnia parasitica CBS 223.65]KDO33336.1 hypothetical protein SPRG_02144 [Saprolegnia parasitica CBS 223.65]|eukprot:XP_012196085.1 hypothetical protein SPRG_02144 [Saprolegnia parasitica CBS 223.65]